MASSTNSFSLSNDDRRIMIEKLVVLGHHNAQIDNNPLLKIEIPRLDAEGELYVLSRDCDTISISSLEECEKLQVEICSFILDCPNFIVNLPTDCCWSLWDCLFSQLEIGGFELKQSSFSILLSLFKSNQFAKRCLRYSLDFSLTLADWFVENWNTIVEPPTSLLLGLIEVLQYFNEMLSGDLHSLTETPFGEENVDYFVELSDRCIKTIIKSGNFCVSRKIVNCLLGFLGKICKTLRVFDFNELSNEQKSLMTNNVVEIVTFCLGQGLIEFAEYPLLFSELILVCPSGKENIAERKNLQSSIQLNEDILLILGQFIFTRESSSEKRLLGIRNEISLKFENDLLTCKTVIESLLLVFKNDLIADSKNSMLNLFTNIIDRLIGIDKYLDKTLKKACETGDKSIVHIVYKTSLEICGLMASFTSSNQNSEELSSNIMDFICYLNFPWLEGDDEAEVANQALFNDISHAIYILYLSLIASYSQKVDGSYESALIRLVNFAISNNEHLSNLAKDEILLVAGRRNFTLKQLYIEASERVLNKLMILFIDDFKQSENLSRLSVEEFFVDVFSPKIHRLCTAFDFVGPNGEGVDLKSWSKLSEKCLIPCLLFNRSPEASKVHKAMAMLLKTNRNSLVSRNVSHVLLKLCLSNLPDDEIKAIVNFVEDEGHNHEKISFSKLVASESFNCIVQLVTHLSLNEEGVLNYLKEVISISKCDDDDSQPIERQVVDELSTKFFGIVITFEEQLRNFDYSMKDKLCAIKSFGCFLKICNVEVLYRAKYKALAVLKIATRIESPDIQKACGSAWLTLVQKLDMENLKNVCLQVFVSLLPFVEKWPEVYESTFRYLCKEKQVDLNDELSDFHFLLDVPEYESVKKCLPLLRRIKSRELNVRDSLAKALKILLHDCTDVKILGLQKLSYVLQTNLNFVYRLVLDAESVDPIIPELMDHLLATLGHSDDIVRYFAAICIGELGAIDPGRLQSNKVCAKVFEKKHCDVADFDTTYNTKFAVSLLTELSNCLTRASFGLSYNVYSYVIQETLKFFDCHPEDETQNSPSEAIFNDLPANVRAIVYPFLSTHFVISKPENDSNDAPLPFFLNYEGLTLKSWLMIWLRFLVKKIKAQKAFTLFEKLSMAAEFELNFARFILPHVVLQKLRESDDVTGAMIFDEIKAVLCGRNKLGPKKEEIFGGNSNFDKQAAQEIFSLLDFLNVWCLQNRSIMEKNLERSRVENLLTAIPYQYVVDCALRSQAYTRALMNFEHDLQRDNDSVHDNLEKLQELYASLGDVDSVTGVLVVCKVKRQPVPREEILAAECLGNYVEALPFHELVTEMEPDKIKNHLALVKCLSKLNQPNLALHYLDGLLKKRTDFDEKLQASRVETLCKLEDWHSLETELNKPQTFKTWGTDVADLLLTVKKNDEALFSDKVRLVRNDLLTRLEAVVRDSGTYDRAYKYVLRLHMVSEIESGAAVLLNLKDKRFSGKTKTDLTQEWKHRLQILQQSTDAFNPILDVRRQVYSLANGEDVRNSVHYSWLQSLRITRKTGHLQSAHSLLPQVKTFNLPETFIEEARLLWLKGDQDAATNCLFRFISSHYKDILEEKSTDVSQERKNAFAKVQLRLANFARESSSTEAKDITRLYEYSLRVCPKHSDAHYYLALHFDQLESNRSTASIAPNFELRLKTIRNYGCSLRYSSKFLHHAMPRMLTLWLDSVSKLNAMVNTPKRDVQKTSKDKSDANANIIESLNKFNNEMLNNAAALPPYQFYSSFSQLISRLGSQSKSTVDVLKDIISRVILVYPQQCLWMSLAVSHSSVEQRKTVCKEIYKLAVGKDKKLQKTIDDFHKLVDLLKAVCFHKGSLLVENMKDMFKELFSLFGTGETRSKFTPIMIPLQSLMDVTLPTPGEGKAPGEFYNPFPSQFVYIHCFEPTIQVFQTLQRPKKVTMRGSDGRRYSILCKPRDDLRLDKRVMEFTSLVNIFLLRDPEARRRQLKIRTYAVTPLSEDFGIIEWVDGLEHIRSVLLKIYKEQNVGLSLDKMKNLCKKTMSLETKLQVYRTDLLPKHPSVLHIWFERCFPDPTAWYLARQNYVRTAAVMSMVGYILGLGDRHGENVLVDTVTGDVVHVDFNCLFNRGEELDVPEVVPFRLTHNMIKAMGPLGYEGPFRKTCEVTMRMMRQEKETLRTVLETFLYDPLVEWKKHDDRIGAKQDYGEVVSEKAHRNLKNIDLRLKGSVPVVEKSGPVSLFKKNSYGSPLNIEGQVNHLIRQATDESLLSQMYMGWAAYM